MIEIVINNLRPIRPHQFIFICQRAHVIQHGLRALFAKWAPGSAVIELDGVTEGAACTVLTAKSFIDDGPLMIANSDQYVDVDIDAYLALQDDGCDGLIMTMTASDPKWSFVGLSDEGFVTAVVEKRVISSEATVGVYNFATGHDFVRAAEAMIAADRRVNGEFYVAPCYNELIASGARIAIKNVGVEGKGMYGLGTPADLELFLSLPVSQTIRRA